MNLLEIKVERLNEVDRFLHDIFDGLVEYESVNYPDIFFYKKDDKLIFEYDSKHQNLQYSYEYIWKIFRDRFKFKYPFTTELIQSMVETNLKLKVKTTVSTPLLSHRKVRWKSI